jgi:hypothetical protein
MFLLQEKSERGNFSDRTFSQHTTIPASPFDRILPVTVFFNLLTTAIIFRSEFLKKMLIKNALLTPIFHLFSPYKAS